MKWKALAALAVAAWFGAAYAQDDAAKDDKAKLQGTWKLVSGEAEGKPAPKDFIEKGVYLKFDGDKVIPSGPGTKQDEQATFKLDPSKKPREIDIIPVKEQDREKKTVRGIYQIDGDTLKLMFIPGRGKADKEGKVTFVESKRPASFESKTGILFIMKREK